MSYLSKFSFPEVEIGECISVLSSNAEQYPVIDTNQGQFLLSGSIANQSDYPQLYQRIGLVNQYTMTTASIGISFGNINSLVYGNGLYLAGGGNNPFARTSTDAITWQAITPTPTANVNFVTYGNGLYVYCGNSGIIVTSPDGVTWTTRTSNTTNQLTKIVYGNGLFVCIGAGNTIRTSTDGITWDTRTSSSASASGITYGAGLYVYSGGTDSYTSTDGITWQYGNTIPTASTFTRIEYGNGIFVAAGNITSQLSVLATSTDAINWVSKNYPISNTTISALSYSNGYFITGDTGGRLGVSTDGKNWQVRSTPTSSQINTITYGNGTYLYGYNSGTYGRSVANSAYDNQTQFQVLEFNPSYDRPTLPNFGNGLSNANFVTYVRAR